MKRYDVGRCPSGGKLQFASAAKARRQGRSYKQTRGLNLGVYQCPSCGLWHLTSRGQS